MTAAVEAGDGQSVGERDISNQRDGRRRRSRVVGWRQAGRTAPAFRGPHGTHAALLQRGKRLVRSVVTDSTQKCRLALQARQICRDRG